MEDIFVLIVKHILDGNIIVGLITILILFSVSAYIVWLISKYFIKDPHKKDYLEIENSIAGIIDTIKQTSNRLDTISRDIRSQLDNFDKENKQHSKEIEKLISFAIINLEEKISRLFTEKFSTLFSNINSATLTSIDDAQDGINSDIAILRADLREAITPHIRELNSRVELLQDLMKQNEFNYVRNIDQIRNVLEMLKNHCQSQRNILNPNYPSEIILSPFKLNDE